jgi:hypothetical protein
MAHQIFSSTRKFAKRREIFISLVKDMIGSSKPKKQIDVDPTINCKILESYRLLLEKIKI